MSQEHNNSIFEHIHFSLQEKEWDDAVAFALQLQDINEHSGPGKRTPLLYFIYFKAPIKYVTLLLEKGCNMNSIDINGFNAIFYCLMQDIPEYIPILVKYGTNIDYKRVRGDIPDDITPEEFSKLGLTALGYELETKCRIEYIKILLDNGANPNIEIYDKWIHKDKKIKCRISTPLIVLLKNNSILRPYYLPIVQLLYNYGARIDINEYFSGDKIVYLSALEQSIHMESYEIFDFLLSKYFLFEQITKIHKKQFNQIYILTVAKKLDKIWEQIVVLKKKKNVFPYNITNFIRNFFNKNDNRQLSNQNEQNKKQLEILQKNIELLNNNRYEKIIDIYDSLDQLAKIEIGRGKGDYDFLRLIANVLYSIERRCYNNALWALVCFGYQQNTLCLRIKESVYQIPINEIELIKAIGHANIAPDEFNAIKDIFSFNQLLFQFSRVVFKPKKEELRYLINCINAISIFFTKRYPVFCKASEYSSEIEKGEKSIFDMPKLLNIESFKLAGTIFTREQEEKLNLLLSLCLYFEKKNEFEFLDIYENLQQIKDDPYILQDTCHSMENIHNNIVDLINNISKFYQQYKFIENENNEKERKEQILIRLFKYTTTKYFNVKLKSFSILQFILDDTADEDLFWTLSNEKLNHKLIFDQIKSGMISHS